MTTPLCIFKITMLLELYLISENVVSRGNYLGFIRFVSENPLFTDVPALKDWNISTLDNNVSLFESVLG